MFGIGPTELIVVLVIALIVVGPERLPQLAGQVGKAIRDFRQMSGDVTGEFQRAFQIDEPPPAANRAMTGEAIGAAPNGAAEATPLVPQVIDEAPVEPTVVPLESTPVAGEDAVLATTDAAIAPGVPVEPLAATKADPLAAVSFLDEPEPEPEPTPAQEPATEAAAYVGMPVATFSPPPLPADEPIPAANPAADAWDAVLSTDATISLPEPSAEELQPATTVGTAVALAEPEVERSSEPETVSSLAAAPPVFADTAPRPRVDPNAEVTIREVIEGQVAAEAFRERRRIARYQRRK